MDKQFFLINTYDSFTGACLARIINLHRDIGCASYIVDDFLPQPSAGAPLVNTTLDQLFKLQDTHKKFCGIAQGFSACEVQYRMLKEKTKTPFQQVTLLTEPSARINYLLKSWLAINRSYDQTLDYIREKCLILQSQAHPLYSLYNFEFFYQHIYQTIKRENLCDLAYAKNHLFVFALAKVITFDSADFPTAARKFQIEQVLADGNELHALLNQISKNKIYIDEENFKQLNVARQQEQNQLQRIEFSLEPWQKKLLNKYLYEKIPTIYYPHIDKPLIDFYQAQGYESQQKQNKHDYSKLLSIQLNSNRPAQLSAFFDNIEATALTPQLIEVLVNIDIGDINMRELLEQERQQRSFTLKYIETPRPKSFCDLWQPINKLLEITDPHAYFLLNTSDEMFFATQHWDQILKKYVGYFPDHIFRLRASRNKLRNYFDRWECSFAQDSIPITTRKWIEIGGDWNPCFGPDSFQQLIAFYLAAEGKFSNAQFLRELPIVDITFFGDVPALGIDLDKVWQHQCDHIKAMQICQSYKMQLEARRRAMRLKAHMYAHNKQINHFSLIDNTKKKTLFLHNNDNQTQVAHFPYHVSASKIFVTNQWRKLAFFNYFGEGQQGFITSRVNFLKYLKMKHKLVNIFFKLLKRIVLFNFKTRQSNIKNLAAMPCTMPPLSRTIEENLKEILSEASTTKPNYPKISIIIGVLNMRAFLGQALDSIINQHYPNAEIIVLDGGSNDGTIEVIKQYERHITFWRSEKDRGHADACNKGIDLAQGDFICLLGADDRLENNILHKVAAVATEITKAQIISCGVNIITRDQSGSEHIIKQCVNPDQLQLKLFNMLFHLPVINARFIHKNIYRKFGKYSGLQADGSYNLSNDRDFLIQLSIAGVKTEIIPIVGYTYLSHADSFTFSNKHTQRILLEHLRLGTKLLDNEQLNTSDKILVKTFLLKESIHLTLTNLTRGRFFFATRALLNGLKLGGLDGFNKLMAIVLRRSKRKVKALLAKR